MGGNQCGDQRGCAEPFPWISSFDIPNNVLHSVLGQMFNLLSPFILTVETQHQECLVVLVNY